MRPEDFRRLALELPEAIESEHMGHPDFRVGGRIFATLGPEGTWGMVTLTPVEQAEWMEVAPRTFDPVPGAWGRKGATRVHLGPARALQVRQALRAAWRLRAPKRLLREADQA
jgi:hypothetical protein